MGAWIETQQQLLNEQAEKSHPMWVRGLKLLFQIVVIFKVLSHPMWVRGLKLLVSLLVLRLDPVAPYVGAWIETRCFGYDILQYFVAPYVGAWIETFVLLLLLVLSTVAPYVGAWIETKTPPE